VLQSQPAFASPALLLLSLDNSLERLAGSKQSLPDSNITSSFVLPQADLKKTTLNAFVLAEIRKAFFLMSKVFGCAMIVFYS